MEWMAYWGVALLLQYLRGDWTGWSGNSDEPAHLLSAVMLRDYFLGHRFESPLAYAQNYYDHYPKIGIGHWPPVFYFLQGAWYLLVPPGYVAALWLMAAMAGTVAVQISREIGRFSRLLGLLFAVLWLTLPATRDAGGRVMAELPVTVFTLSGVCLYSRYLEQPGVMRGAGFGILSSLAILTKATGAVMAFVPLAAILQGRCRLLTHWSYWVPLAILTALCLPWYLLAPGARHERAEPMGGLGLMPHRWQHFVGNPELLPAILWVAAAGGLAYAVYRARSNSFVAAGLPFVAANVLGTSVVAVWELRHGIMILPVLLIFCAAALHAAGWQRIGAAAAMGMAMFCLTLDMPPVRIDFAKAAKLAKGLSPVLVAGQADLEGGFICEYALQEHRPGGVVLRGSKALVTLSWFGQEREQLFHSPPEVARYLAAADVKMVVLDSAAPAERSDVRLLKETIGQDQQWEPVPLTSSRVRMWRRAHAN